MLLAWQRTRAYLWMRITGPAPLLLLGAAYAGSARRTIEIAREDVDLHAFLASGRALIASDVPYHAAGANNMNAPASLPFVNLLALLDGPSIIMGWFLATFALYLLALLILARMYPRTVTRTRLAWAMAHDGLWGSLAFGQIYTVLLLPFTAAHWAIEHKRLALAGLLAGLAIAFKPNFLVWPVLLIVAGHRRLGFALLAGAILWCLPPVLLYGPQVYGQWFDMVAARLPIELSFPHNRSIQSIAYRMGAGWLGLPLAGALLAAVMLWAWRLRPEPGRLTPVALLAGILASPVAWSGYILFVIPALLSRPWNRPLWMAAALLLIPLWPWPFLGDGYRTLWTASGVMAYACLLVGFWLPVRQSPACTQRMPILGPPFPGSP